MMRRLLSCSGRMHIPQTRDGDGSAQPWSSDQSSLDECKTAFVQFTQVARMRMHTIKSTLEHVTMKTTNNIVIIGLARGMHTHS